MDLMLDRFANGDAAVRDQAVKWLLEAAKHHGPSVREHMLRLLGEGEDAIRRLCVEIMLETGEPVEVLTTILEFLHGLLGWLRGQIIDTLKSFGDRMFRPAVHLLQHEDEDIRSTALQVAESFQDPRLVGPLCRMLQDEDWWLKVTAADSLGQLGDPDLAEMFGFGQVSGNHLFHSLATSSASRSTSRQEEASMWSMICFVRVR